MSMAELASAAPTSGGVSNDDSMGNVQTLNIVMRLTQLYFWTHSYSSPSWRNLLAWIVGCMLFQLKKIKVVLFLSCRC